MSREWAEKAVYYRSTTGGKTKWVKIEDVTYQEGGNRLRLYDWNEDTAMFTVDNRRIFQRNVR